MLKKYLNVDKIEKWLQSFRCYSENVNKMLKKFSFMAAILKRMILSICHHIN